MPGIRYFPLTFAFLVAFAGAAVGKSAAPDSAIVKIDSGEVRGVVPGGVISFKGIPTPNLRSGVALAPAATGDPLDEDPERQSIRPELHAGGPVPKSEDCLALNLWRPVAASAAPLPVMVWIY